MVLGIDYMREGGSLLVHLGVPKMNQVLFYMTKKCIQYINELKTGRWKQLFINSINYSKKILFDRRYDESIHLFQVRWIDHFASYFPLLYRYGINIYNYIALNIFS